MHFVPIFQKGMQFRLPARPSPIITHHSSHFLCLEGRKKNIHDTSFGDGIVLYLPLPPPHHPITALCLRHSLSLLLTCFSCHAVFDVSMFSTLTYFHSMILLLPLHHSVRLMSIYTLMCHSKFHFSFYHPWSPDPLPLMMTLHFKSHHHILHAMHMSLLWLE